MNKNTPSKNKEEILKLLNEGKTPSEISKILNLVECSTQQMCAKLGFTFKPNQGNIRYFKNIDTHIKAYFLGFIAADGGIVKNTLTITIHEKDKIILDKLREEIGCEKPIQQINTFMGFDKTRRVDHVRFTLTNSLLISDLNNKGIYSKKSMTISNIIINIPEQFRDSFIIGYFDGDGSAILPKGKIKKQNNKYYPSYSIHVSFRGTLPFLQGIASHLQIEKHIFFNKTYILTLTKKEHIVRFFKCYKNLDFYLKRKYDKFLERINHESFQKIIQEQTISSP